MVRYEFYTGVYLGSAIPETAFTGMAARAQGVLERFQRVYRMEPAGDDARNMAICAMAETLYAEECRESGVCAAAVGNVSVRYEAGRHPRRALMERLYEQASVYLDFYRGVNT